jgi:hypothetical protein
MREAGHRLTSLVGTSVIQAIDRVDGVELARLHARGDGRPALGAEVVASDLPRVTNHAKEDHDG